METGSLSTSSTSSVVCSPPLSSAPSFDSPLVEGEADLAMADAEGESDRSSTPTRMEEESAPEPVMVLKLANKEGRVKYTLSGASDSGSTLGLPTDSPLHFVAGRLCSGRSRCTCVVSMNHVLLSVSSSQSSSTEWSASGADSLDASKWTNPTRDRSVDEAEEAARQPPKPLDLLSCVHAFLQREQLDADDTWYCSKCKQHVQVAWRAATECALVGCFKIML